MKTFKRSFLTLLLALSMLPAGRAAAQGFGFGSASDDGTAPEDSAPAAAAIRVSGEVTLGALLFPNEVETSAAAGLSNASEARLNFSVQGTSLDAALKLKMTESALYTETAADFLSDAVDEAYLRFFFGPVTVQTGLLKVVWGKADSQGPLDVLNPYNLTDLSVTDTLDRKIAQLMARATVDLGGMSKVEAAFLPSFEGHRIASTGTWAPSQAAKLAVASKPDTSTLDYAQGGVRFSTTTGSVDWGVQYFYGYLPTPAIRIVASATPPYYVIDGVLYNRYHQIGADAATVLAGFNLRAELAGNITEDTSGDDPYVYNPDIAFSLGFDRDIAAGINLNLQYAGTYRFMDDKIISPFDIESGTDAFNSTLTAVVFQKLFRDKFEWTIRALWGVQDKDCYLLPGVSWTEGDAEISLSAGIFAGDEGGELGQYVDSSYLKLTLTYSF